jgi:hypothetical protein
MAFVTQGIRWCKWVSAAVCLLPTCAMAWFDGGYPAPAYPPYQAPIYPPYGGYYGGPGYPGYNYWPEPYGYAEPRWYFRGRMNRYGDYEIRIHVENINLNDFYNAWQWYMNNQY